jgi:hypothetical protein
VDVIVIFRIVAAWREMLGGWLDFDRSMQELHANDNDSHYIRFNPDVKPQLNSARMRPIA